MNELWKSLGAEMGPATNMKEFISVRCYCAFEGHGIASEDFEMHWTITFGEIEYYSWDSKDGWQKDRDFGCMYLHGKSFDDAKAQALLFLKWWNKQ